MGKKKQRKLKKSNTSLIHLSNDLRELQFSNYKDIHFKDTNKLIKKYFTPSNEINKIIQTIEDKYKELEKGSNYQNICVLFYRGNDKNKETITGGYEEYLEKAELLLKENPNIQFLVQSDETEFLELVMKRFPTNSFYFKDEIRHMNRCNTSVDLVNSKENYGYSKKFLAITYIMSKCEYIICNSGNCSLWIMLYRGKANNVYQYLSAKEYIWGVKNEFYDEKESDYWL